MTFYEWRVKNNISQGAVALTLGEPPYSIIKYDNGEELPKFLHKVFERRFGISPKQFKYNKDTE